MPAEQGVVRLVDSVCRSSRILRWGRFRPSFGILLIPFLPANLRRLHLIEKLVLLGENAFLAFPAMTNRNLS